MAVVITLAVIVIGVGLPATMKNKTIIIEEDRNEVLPQKPAKTIENYYPVVKDSVWEYNVKSKLANAMTVSVDFIKGNVFQLRYDKHNATYVKVFLLEEDVLYEVAMIEDDFIKNDYTLLRQYKEVALKLPLDVGNSWVIGDGAIRTITGVDQVIDTPMGEIKTIEVTTIHDDYELVQWYGEEMGLVSSYYEAASGKEKVVLKEYSTNKPIKTYIEVYYPDMEKEKLDYSRQAVTVMTNEEPKHFLTDILSLELNENTIQPLPVDAYIVGLYVEEDEDTVYIDLSTSYHGSEYTKEEEKLALQSVVKTIGSYYKTDYVTLTVNGEGYREKIKVR